MQGGDREERLVKSVEVIAIGVGVVAFVETVALVLALVFGR
jgi:hypothetical protein